MVGLKLTSADDDIIMIADTGIMIRIHTSDISKIGRNTKGVRLMRIKGEGKVAAVALTPHEEEEVQPVEETEVTATETEVVATETPTVVTDSEN